MNVNVIITKIKEGSYKFHKMCSIEHTEYSVPSTAAQLFRLNKCQETVQEIYPELDAEQREFIISGYTPSEWVKAFGA